MPKISLGLITAANASTFRTDEGGCRRSTPEEWAQLPKFEHPTIMAADAPVAPLSYDFRDGYNSRFKDKSQENTGTCTGQAAATAFQLVSFTQGGVIVEYSAFFIYYADTGDRTYKYGSGVSNPVYRAAQVGCCLESLYPEGEALRIYRAWPGNEFTDAQLPQPAAYADALNRKVIRFSSLYAVLPDINVLKNLCASGYAFVFGMGNHAMCVACGYSENVFFAKDSKMPNEDFGYGRGIRAFAADTLYQNGFDYCVIELMQTGAGIIPPPTGNPAIIAALKLNQTQTESLTGALIAG